MYGSKKDEWIIYEPEDNILTMIRELNTEDFDEQNPTVVDDQKGVFLELLEKIFKREIDY